jgi:hypothetical protein
MLSNKATSTVLAGIFMLLHHFKIQIQNERRQNKDKLNHSGLPLDPTQSHPLGNTVLNFHKRKHSSHLYFFFFFIIIIL